MLAIATMALFAVTGSVDSQALPEEFEAVELEMAFEESLEAGLPTDIQPLHQEF